MMWRIAARSMSPQANRAGPGVTPPPFILEARRRCLSADARRCEEPRHQPTIGNLSLLLLDDPLASCRIIFCILLGIGQVSVFLSAQSRIGQAAPWAAAATRPLLLEDAGPNGPESLYSES
jgi:hypothetical protein